MYLDFHSKHVIDVTEPNVRTKFENEKRNRGRNQAKITFMKMQVSRRVFESRKDDYSVLIVLTLYPQPCFTRILEQWSRFRDSMVLNAQ